MLASYSALSQAQGVIILDDTANGGTLQRIAEASLARTPMQTLVLAVRAGSPWPYPFAVASRLQTKALHLVVPESHQDDPGIVAAVHAGAFPHLTPHVFPAHLNSRAKAVARAVQGIQLPSSPVSVDASEVVVQAASRFCQDDPFDELWVYGSSSALVHGLAASGVAQSLHVVCAGPLQALPTVRYLRCAYAPTAPAPVRPPVPASPRLCAKAWPYARARAQAQPTRRIAWWVAASFPA